MRDQQILRQLSEQLSRLLPGVDNLRDEARTKIEQTLKNGLRDLDIMTQEEFAAQAKALEHTQERVRQLETRLGDLETRMQTLDPADSA